MHILKCSVIMFSVVTADLRNFETVSFNMQYLTLYEAIHTLHHISFHGLADIPRHTHTPQEHNFIPGSKRLHPGKFPHVLQGQRLAPAGHSKPPHIRRPAPSARGDTLSVPSCERPCMQPKIRHSPRLRVRGAPPRSGRFGRGPVGAGPCRRRRDRAVPIGEGFG